MPPARGRDFRLELEHALGDTEVSIFFHPGRYQPGLHRSPRIDLVPLPEGRYPKLHAKVVLMRFVTPAAPEAARQIIRLMVGSANLTGSGYRSNIEVATSVDDVPGGSPEAATAVRDAVDWLERLVKPSTEQVTRQLRDMKAVFASRPAPRRDTRLRFVGLPSANGFPPLAGPRERVNELTIASPFWPSGDDLADVATALARLCGGHWETVRLIGPANLDERGNARPVIPARVGFDDHHIHTAWLRLESIDPWLCNRMRDSWRRARSGRSKHSSFWEDLREICRAALGQTVPHRLPLVIVDEIHNWKNHPTSWWRFLHTLGLRMDRLLGLSATPFQLGAARTHPGARTPALH